MDHAVDEAVIHQVLAYVLPGAFPVYDAEGAEDRSPSRPPGHLRRAVKELVPCPFFLSAIAHSPVCISLGVVIFHLYMGPLVFCGLLWYTIVSLEILRKVGCPGRVIQEVNKMIEKRCGSADEKGHAATSSLNHFTQYLTAWSKKYLNGHKFLAF